MEKFIGNQLPHIISYCKEVAAHEVEETIRIAEDLLNYSFMFESKWELERTYIPVVFEDGNILWDQIPFGDEEWVFAMNRHRCFVTLACAYALTGEEKYTERFIDLLTHWIQYSPLNDKNKGTTWRTIETGLRCENWIKAHEIFENSPLWTEELETLFRESLTVHGKHILAHNDDFRRLSNWGVIENHGLFLAGLFLENNEMIQTAKARLEKATKLQMLGDGLHWEQSQVYHNEVLRAMVDVAICAKKNGLVMDAGYHEVVKKMLHAHIAMTRPNHIQLANGDSDDIDARDLLVRASYVYEDEVFKSLAYSEVDFESIWDLGMEGKADYDALAIKYPEYTSFALEASGNYCMRSGWQEEAGYVHFKCGNLGGGHGHVDLLHLDISYLGEDVIRDQGRYTYTNTKERFALKEAKAHNTTLVDGKEFIKILDTWGYSDVAVPIQRPFITHELYDYVEGAHLGYMSLESSVFTNRKVLYIKPNIVVVVDEFVTQGEHTYEQYFHFGEGKVTLGDQTTYEGERVHATLYHPEALDRQVVMMPSSKTYNHIEDLATLVTKKVATGNKALTTIFVLEDKDKMVGSSVTRVPMYTEGRVLEGDESSEAFNIQVGEEIYTVVIRHDEKNRRLMVVEGQDIYGRVTLIKHDPNGAITHTIVW